MRGESVKSHLVYLYGCGRAKVSNSVLKTLFFIPAIWVELSKLARRRP